MRHLDLVQQFLANNNFNLKTLSIEPIWVLVVFGICFSYICIMPIDQYDFWQHLKVGEIIFNSKHILSNDIFTFTIPRKPYIDMHWGAQVYYYILYVFGGLKLLIFSHALLLTLAYAFVFRTSYIKTNSLKTSSIATLISLVISMSNFALRPQEFSILFFSILFYLLQSKKLYLIPFIFFFWANFHGGFLAGFLLICAHLLEEINFKEKIFFNHEIFSTLLISILFTLINPYGVELYSTLFKVAPASSKITKISEWMPSSFNDETGRMFFIFLILLVVIQLWKRLRWTKTEILSFFIFTLLAFKYQRAVIWWGIVTVPIFSRYISLLVPNQPQKASPNDYKINLIFGCLISTLFISYLPWFKENNPLVPAIKRSLTSAETPIELAKRLSALKESKRIFNNFSWGSYFIWSLREDQKLFFDPKDFIYPKEIIEDYFLVSNGEKGWEKILSKYDTDTVAIGKEEQSGLIEEMRKSDQWENTYEDRLGYIFTTSPDNCLTSDRKKSLKRRD